MNKRRALAVAGIAAGSLVAIVILAAIVGWHILMSRPSIKFLLTNSGFRDPADYVKSEIVIHVKGEPVPVMVYRHPKAVSDRYFILQHGLTPEGHKHPKIDRFAASLCEATGMNVLIPYVRGSVEGGSLEDAYRRMAEIYTAASERFPGRYRAFGACIGANILLVALRRVSPKIYPEKIFLLGPFFRGDSLFSFYNRLTRPEDIDIMVKMAITLNMNVFSEKEKELIRRAIASSKPGPTDRSEMKKILGEKLFNDIAVVKLHHRDFESIGPETMFSPAQSRCRYFILHSKNDNIIPYFEGRNLAAFMRRSGISTRFLGTEILDHAENQTSVSGFVAEMKHLIRFFDELFEGDIAI